MADQASQGAPERVWLAQGPQGGLFAYRTPGVLGGEREYVSAAVAAELVEALRACEENLRLIHEAAGPVPPSAPMPKHSAFGAWELASAALSRYAALSGKKEG